MLLNGIIFSSYYFLLQVSSHRTMVIGFPASVGTLGGCAPPSQPTPLPSFPPLLGEAPQNLMGGGLSQNTGGA